MDQLTAIRAFARVVEAGTFTRAAESLQMPAPRVTKLIQQLEKHLRLKLLQRTTRRVTVTPEGAAYYARTARLLTDLDDIESDLSAAQGDLRGRLRVDVGSSVANLILIPRLPEFVRRHPNISLELGVGDRPVDLIGDAVDCVIRGGALFDETLVARRIALLDFVTVATPGYLRRHGRPKTPNDLLEGHRLLGYFSTRDSRQVPLVYGLDERRTEIAVRNGISVNESTAHLTTALNGLGIAQTFDFMVAPHVRAGTLVEVLPDHRPAPIPLHVVYPQNRHPSVKLRAFIDWVVDVFAAYRDPG